jgi:DNA-binding Lrp family transcriptional regulator
MLKVCALIKVMPPRTNAVLNIVKEYKEIEKAYVAYGRFDIVAFCKAEDYKEVRAISGKINSIDGVRSTETLVEA